jgi:dTDP-4-amino-4,6-dideoxygalactose transaminase
LIPVARPLMPPAEAILPYLKRMDAQRVYSNFGPLARELEARLARHFGLLPECVVTASNATAALSATLSALIHGAGGICLLPSWTFCASAHAVVAAGLQPHFLDVDPHSWRLTAEAAQRALAHVPNVRAVMPVAPFGAPVNVAPWEEFSKRTGVPVLIDAAAAFAGQHAGDVPVVISLHATKILGAGEGGAVLTRNKELIEDVTRRLNFGFYGVRSASVAGINGKLSEYSAAVGLASLDAWPKTRIAWSQLLARYERALDARGISRTRPLNSGLTSTLVFGFPGDAKRLASLLGEAGIATLRWYSDACHAEPAFRDCTRAALPVTENLVSSCLGLPFYLDLEDQAIDQIANTLAAIQDCSSEQNGRVSASLHSLYRSLESAESPSVRSHP